MCAVYLRMSYNFKLGPLHAVEMSLKVVKNRNTAIGETIFRGYSDLGVYSVLRPLELCHMEAFFLLFIVRKVSLQQLFIKIISITVHDHKQHQKTSM